MISKLEPDGNRWKGKAQMIRKNLSLVETGGSAQMIRGTLKIHLLEIQLFSGSLNSI